MSKKLSSKEKESLLQILQQRFEKNMHRHKGISWTTVSQRLESNPEAIWSLHEMEKTGGEPDVIGKEKDTDRIIFCDCSKESPKGRRSLCYDKEAWQSRKEHRPPYNAVDMACDMGVELLDEPTYRKLQELEEFDLKTSSWIATPEAIRQLGGALFCDRRYDHVFVYHNGASSYYAARGFRCQLTI